MPSKYDGLDASRELEQAVYADLRLAFEPRGCKVTHYGSDTGHAPGGKPDLEVVDKKNKRLLLVEVTKRKGSAADGEFISVTDHLEKAVAAGGYDDYCCLFVSPATSARMSANIRNLYNRDRARARKHGRVVAMDFAGLEMLLKRLAEANAKLYPAARLGDIFSQWDIAKVMFAEDERLTAELSTEMRRQDADREQRLKKAIEKMENSLRDLGITGSDANQTLIYLTFVRLYEEKQETEGKGKGRENRFTATGFKKWCESMPVQLRTAHREHMIEPLITEIAEDPDLQVAGLLQITNGQKNRLHNGVTDERLYSLVLPLFDEYEFYGSAVDVLGVVFESLAGRAEKDTRVGQFFTPQEVVNFCAEVADLGPRDIVLDPAVGTARFLIAAMDRMLKRADEVPGVARAKTEKSIRMKQLIGVDLDRWVSTIAKMNMYIHGDGKSNIVNVNGLILGDRKIFQPFSSGLADSVDVVLTNPPLGYTSFMVAAQHWADCESPPPPPEKRIEFLKSLGTVPLRAPATKESRRLSALVDSLKKKNEEIELLQAAAKPDPKKIAKAKKLRDKTIEEMKGVQPLAKTSSSLVPEGEKLKGGALFLGAIATYLKKVRRPDATVEDQGGTAVLVIDEAILNTSDYADTRAFIRRNFFVKAVISLGRDAFKYLAHTSAKTSILYLVRKPNEHVVQNEPILYAHAEKVGYNATGRWVGSDLPGVLTDLLAARRIIMASYTGASFRKKDCAKCLAKEYGHRVRWHARDAGSGGDRLDYYYARFRDLSDALIGSGQAVLLGDLIEPRTLADRRPDSSPTSEYDCAVVQRVGVVSPKGTEVLKYRAEDLWIVRDGDITISGIDLVYRAAAIAGPDVDGLVMSKEMFAYRVKDGVDVLPEYVVVMLRTEPVNAMILGRVSGTSGRLRVNDPREILDIPVLKPPTIKEQEDVVKVAREAAYHRKQATVSLAKAAQMIVAKWPV